MSVHDGHRDRLRARFIKTGMKGFEPHEALELLLFYTRPRGNTNPLAHELIKHFGSISKVLDAPMEELLECPGVGEHTALLLKMLPPLFSMYMEDRQDSGLIIQSTQDAGDFFIPKFIGAKNEQVYLMTLDDKHKMIRCKQLGEGTVNASEITVRRIVAEALGANATTAILAHNHPSGVALPSGNDRAVTARIYAALKIVNVKLEDHIIVADGDYVSMADSSFFTQLEAELY